MRAKEILVAIVALRVVRELFLDMCDMLGESEREREREPSGFGYDRWV